MRKRLLVLLACLLVLGWFSVPVYAQMLRSGPSYSSVNATGAVTDTLVAVTTIIPGKCRILGVDVCPYDATSVTNYVYLYDLAATTSITSSNEFYSYESRVGESGGRTFPQPKDLQNGLCIRQGPETRVTVFYERVKP